MTFLCSSSSTTALRCLRRLTVALLLALPLGAAALVIAPADAAAGPQYHTVYDGQRLGSIAKRYRVTVEALCEANDLKATDKLKPGMRLVIPGKDGAPAKRDEAKKPVPSGRRGTYEVQSGDTLSGISHKTGVSVDQLRDLNGLPKGATLQPGQVVAIDVRGKKEIADSAPKSEKPSKGEKPGKGAKKEGKPVVHRVARGHTLGKIAKRYRVTLDELCAANGLSQHASLKIGQELAIPSPQDPSGRRALQQIHSPVDEPEMTAPKRGKSWKAYVKPPKKRGYVRLERYALSWEGFAIDSRGKLLPAAREGIARVLGEQEDGPDIDVQLMKRIVKVSDRFGGRPLRVVSGYRERSYAAHSRHRTGRAIDFSIRGVPNEAMRDFLRAEFPDAGVGYYPNSSFVHFDLRDVGTYWVDFAGPGQRPRYARNGRRGPQPSGARRARNEERGDARSDRDRNEEAVADDDADGTDRDDEDTGRDDGEAQAGPGAQPVADQTEPPAAAPKNGAGSAQPKGDGPAAAPAGEPQPDASKAPGAPAPATASGGDAEN